MKRILIGLMAALAGFAGQGQEPASGQPTIMQDSIHPAKKPVPRLATIETLNEEKLKGWFFKIDADNIYLLPAEKRHKRSEYYKDPDFSKKSIAVMVEQVNKLSLQRGNAALKGTLIGFGVGAVTGVVIGLASGNDPVYNYSGDNPLEIIAYGVHDALAMTAGEKALVNGIVFGVSGGLVGFLIGKFSKKEFIIGGRKDRYRQLHNELLNMTLEH